MSKVKQLDQSVFKIPDCPDWARSAAVDSDGQCFVYSCYIKDLDKDDGSWNDDGTWIAINADTTYIRIGHGYDTTDWENSAIDKEYK